MDHLPLPKHPTVPRSRVPLVCGRLNKYSVLESKIAFEEEPYDRGSFLEWPDRNDEAKNKIYSSSGAEFDRDMQSILQSWLFFGLLHEFLQDLFDPCDYVEQDEHGPVIRTTKLLSRLKDWHEINTDLDTDEQDDIYDRLMPCLRRAREVLGVVGHQDRRRERMDKGVKMSILAVAETLTDALENTFWEELEGGPIFGLSYWDDSAVADMIAHNWCPSEIARVREVFTAVSTYDYLRRMSKPSRGRSHDECTESDCQLSNVDETLYRTRHMCKTEDCGFVGVDVRTDLMRCLDDDKLPLINVTGSSLEEIAIQTVKQDVNTPYVAISHVWADGLGNQFENALPRCQLLRLREHIDHLCRQIRNDRGDEVQHLLLWCDTLCCPTAKQRPATAEERSQKAKALAKMRDVYADATYVLVLDSSLEEYPAHEMDTLEASMRVLTSQWIHRLWTFEEGVLAYDAIFQFKPIAEDGSGSVIRLPDSIFNLGALLANVDALLGTSLEFRRIGWDIITQLLTISGSAIEGVKREGVLVESLAQGLRYRRTSRAEDEPICIAGLLNYSHEAISSIARLRGLDERMSLFWRLMPQEVMDVGAHIIFSNCERLGTNGMRWAPRSFRQHIMDIKPEFRIFGFDDPDPSQITTAGLSVKFPGFRIRWQGKQPDRPSQFSWDTVTTIAGCPLRLPDDRWFWLWGPRTLPQLEETSKEDFWAMCTQIETPQFLLLSREPARAAANRPDDISQVLWAAADHQVDGTTPLHVRSCALLCLTEMNTRDQQVWQLATACANQFNRYSTPLDIARLTARAAAGDLDDGFLKLAKLSVSVGNDVRSDRDMESVVKAWAPADTDKKLGALILEVAGENFLGVEERFGPEQAWVVD